MLDATTATSAATAHPFLVHPLLGGDVFVVLLLVSLVLSVMSSALFFEPDDPSFEPPVIL